MSFGIAVDPSSTPPSKVYYGFDLPKDSPLHPCKDAKTFFEAWQFPVEPSFYDVTELNHGLEEGDDEFHLPYGIEMCTTELSSWMFVAIFTFLTDELEWELIQVPYGENDGKLFAGKIWSNIVGD